MPLLGGAPCSVEGKATSVRPRGSAIAVSEWVFTKRQDTLLVHCLSIRTDIVVVHALLGEGETTPATSKRYNVVTVVSGLISFSGGK
jgi:hypothetical protein